MAHEETTATSGTFSRRRALRLGATALASAAAETGDADLATRYYLRILERDPYDESAHLGLVDLEVGASDPEEARAEVELMCAELLANPLIESYEIELMEGS